MWFNSSTYAQIAICLLKVSVLNMAWNYLNKNKNKKGLNNSIKLINDEKIS